MKPLNAGRGTATGIATVQIKKFCRYFHLSRVPVSCLLSICLFAAIAHADIYRWRDAEGKWHFSDSPHHVPAELREGISRDNASQDQLSIVTTQPAAAGPSVMTRPQAPENGTISIPFTAREGFADRVIVDVTFNHSVTAPMLVDTGSPGLVLATDLAAELGLFDPEGENMLVLIAGIGGTKVAARAIVDQLSIGGAAEHFVPAHIIPGQSPAYRGLIGMDILSQYTLTIDSDRQRLIAAKRPLGDNRPAGRSRAWWQKNFRELDFYISFWQRQAEALDRPDSPYSRLSKSYEQVQFFIQRQQGEARKLYDRFERYARQHSVPRHWRR